MARDLVLIRGAGDLASGVALRLFNSGFRIIMLETQKPSSIRRTVCFSEAVYDKEVVIEGVKGVLSKSPEDALRLSNSCIAVLVDSNMDFLSTIKPYVIVDAILAKKNLGMKAGMAPLTIALGPGFEAGVDADYVIETARSHYLGRIISTGSATPNTGIPGNIAGFSSERVIHSTNAGVLKALKKIGDTVKKDQAIAIIDGVEQRAKISGVLRGLIRDGFIVPREGFKIADVDPREDSINYIHLSSDKAMSIAGGVLECIMHHKNKSPYRIEALPDTMKKSVTAYTDGSYNVQSHEYSYGVVIILENGSVQEFYKKFDADEDSQYRNVAGELQGSMAVMNYCIEHKIKEVTICFDYQGIESWCTGEWKTNNSLTRGYKEFCDSIKSKLSIKFVKVKAHSGDKYNQRADSLAALALKEVQ